MIISLAYKVIGLIAFRSAKVHAHKESVDELFPQNLDLSVTRMNIKDSIGDESDSNEKDDSTNIEARPSTPQ